MSEVETSEAVDLTDLEVVGPVVLNELEVVEPVVLEELETLDTIVLDELVVTEAVALPIVNIYGGAVLAGEGPPSLIPGDPNYTEGVELKDNYIDLVTGDFYILEEVDMTPTWVPVGNLRGPAGDVFYFEHEQSIPSSGWVIEHNLGKRPNTEILIDNEVVEADVSHINQNTIYIEFASPQTGKVILT